MDNLSIHCNICNTKTSVKRGNIYMKCMCDDERRIIPLNEFINLKIHTDYLYSKNDNNICLN